MPVPCDHLCQVLVRTRVRSGNSDLDVHGLPSTSTGPVGELWGDHKHSRGSAPIKPSTSFHYGTRNSE